MQLSKCVGTRPCFEFWVSMTSLNHGEKLQERGHVRTVTSTNVLKSTFKSPGEVNIINSSHLYAGSKN